MAEATTPATGPLKSLSTHKPQPGRSYLIRADYGAGVVYDVAFYNGRDASGGHWWTMGDVNIPARCVTHFAEITESIDQP